MKNTIYTVGHSTRTIENFITLMKTYKIETVVDVRTIAGSSYNPQYNQKNLDKSLSENNISYIRLERLGGLRHTTKESINMGWKNKSFRGYADYMQTSEFEDGIKELIAIAKKKQIVIMCAEAVPWRCHRSLIGDALVVRNIKVVDVMSEINARPHKLTPFAHVVGRTITYPKTGNENVAN